MIRQFETQDLDNVMTLWLETNIAAHDFIKEDYWKSNYPIVKEMMPQATIYVYEQDQKVKGFVGISGTYIAGIFVETNYQSKGIGRELLKTIKKNHDELTLQVYQKNKRAVQFYLKEGFIVVREQLDEQTNEIEFLMRWEKK